MTGRNLPRCSDVGLPRTAVLGVLGGGQLGKMLAMEAVSGSFRLSDVAEAL